MNLQAFSIKAGALAAVVGLIAFTLSWNFYAFWDGPLPGYQVFLFPGNLTLIYIWHPLFTEEIDLYPKLALLLLGQFALVAGVTEIGRRLARKILG